MRIKVAKVSIATVTRMQLPKVLSCCILKQLYWLLFLPIH